MIEQTLIRRPRWGSETLVGVRGALCEDGAQRTARVTAEPDTFFSIPARVSVKGKTVSGFLSTDRICTRCLRAMTSHNAEQANGELDFSKPRCDDGELAIEQEQVYLFTAYSYGKNASLLKGETQHA